jgi:hypothetical protein
MIGESLLMSASFVIASLRILTWFCVILLAVLSLLPAQDMMRTGLPGELEHFAAYAGSAAMAVAGYGRSRRGMRIIGLFWVYASGSSILPKAGFRRSRISRPQSLERCAAGSPSPFSGAAPSARQLTSSCGAPPRQIAFDKMARLMLFSQHSHFEAGQTWFVARKRAPPSIAFYQSTAGRSTGTRCFVIRLAAGTPGFLRQRRCP